MMEAGNVRRLHLVVVVVVVVVVFSGVWIRKWGWVWQCCMLIALH